MKYGFFDSSELQNPDDPQRSPFPHVVHDDLLNLLNRIRRKWGRPIIVNSGYRSPEWNKKVGGVDGSYHTKGLAADIRPEHQQDLIDLQDLCLDLNLDGGVGLYDTFVHVDARGTKARWDNRRKNGSA